MKADDASNSFPLLHRILLTTFTARSKELPILFRYYYGDLSKAGRPPFELPILFRYYLELRSLLDRWLEMRIATSNSFPLLHASTFNKQNPARDNLPILFRYYNAGDSYPTWPSRIRLS